ncbi:MULTISPECIES: anti-sigma factor [Bacillus]|uniref:Anti-sigma factor n=1 Tax=Bacillus thuringiensis serovar sooncheon TaxID=180891 RepID=A0A9Q5SID8_BACTU|nr:MULTISPECIES: anti-sigma factor [Bacillus]MCP1166438.1 anti-sigma factor [Bacillus sp. 1813sda1]OTW69565.1 anti-sigma factor [Bacillus thuringiensis serovar coreanensis]OTX45762.1 anti-sigma factor [Bacillus thuringiensis serovar sooncheon]OTX48625.1 anti-sigma factor [Bacillus thuringiensis serovar guiyangiensis]OTX63648.1 anti-sigma factor [Bacillus thuringiensis serovar roskildiensis]
MKEFVNSITTFETAGIIMLLACILLLICVASWVYTDAKAHGISKWWGVVAIIVPFFIGVLIYMLRRNKKKVDGEHKVTSMKKQKLTLVAILASTMFVLLSGFTFVQTLDDAWRAGDIYLENEEQAETSYEAEFSSWDIAGKDITLQYDKDTTVTFSYETDAKRGNLCFSLYEVQGEKIEELKEVCESKKGTFTATLKANQKYTLNISGVKVKEGFVKVDWKEK